MPFSMLDLILAGIMLISGLLALMRGFTREVLAIIAWGVAAVAAVAAVMTPELKQFVEQYVQPEIVAMVVLGASVFLVVLIITSLISVRLADAVLDSAAGPFDRTLGLIYGLARGLLLVVVAYLFYIWLIPRDKHEDWVLEARSLPIIESVGGFMISFLPPEIAETLEGKTYIDPDDRRTRAGDQEQGSGALPAYRPSQQRNLDQLIEGTDEATGFGGQN